ncbi:hypothetical protein [Salinibaculum salinum]|uniref:hypothetical protein n=1 Tax=Salinibaculum salinum TaxID=3131996 RepID=UPI0030EEF5E6
MKPLLSRLAATVNLSSQFTPLRVDTDDPLHLDDRKMGWKSEQIDGGDSISRRALLKYGGGVAGGAGLLGGGWLFYDRLLRERTPQETVRQYYAALDNGNEEKANGLIHEDSPVSGNSETFISIAEQADLTVQEVEVVDQSDDQATVRVTVHIEYDTSEEDTQTVTRTLRKSDGMWKLWLESDGGN